MRFINEREQWDSEQRAGDDDHGERLIFGAATVGTAVTGAGSGFTSRIITSSDGDNAEDRVVRGQAVTVQPRR
jgi:hypothetical protein